MSVKLSDGNSLGKKSGVTNAVFAVVVVILLIVAGGAAYYSTVHVSTLTTTVISSSVSTSISTSVATSIATSTLITSASTHVVLDLGGNYITVPSTITRAVDDGSGTVTDEMCVLGAANELVISPFGAQANIAADASQIAWLKLACPSGIEGTTYWNVTGTGYNLNIEQVLAAKAQVYIAGRTGTGSGSLNPSVYQSVGIPVVMLNVFGNFSQDQQSDYLLGSMFGPKVMAQAVLFNQFINSTLQYINATLTAHPPASKPNVSTFWLLARASGNLNLVYNEASANANMLYYLDANDVATPFCTTAGGNACIVSDETLLQMNPSILFINEGTNLTMLQKDPVLSQLAAVKSGQVYNVPNGPFGTWESNDPARILAIVWAASILYPTLFPQSYLTNETNYFYNTFTSMHMNSTLLTDQELSLPPS